MSEVFDPYRKWLGIAPHEQPPHLYRLLGIGLFEDDPDVIENAADRQMAHVRTFQGGPHRDLTQKLLNELSSAKMTLLDRQRKAAYDAQLRARLAAPGMPLAAMPVPLQAPVPPPAAPRMPTAPMAVPVQPTAPQPAPIPVVSSSRRIASRARGRRRNSLGTLILGLVALGTVLVGLLVFIVTATDEPPSVAPGPKQNAPPSASSEPSGPLPAEQKEGDAKAETKPGTPAAPRGDALSQELVEARAALARRDYVAARMALDAIRDQRREGAEAAEFEQLAALDYLIDDFWRGVRVGASPQRTPAGEPFAWRDDEIEIVRRDSSQITFRLNGQEETVPLKAVPPAAAVAFASRGLNLNQPRAAACMAAFLAIDAQATATQRRLAREYAADALRRGYTDAPFLRELKLEAASPESPAPPVNKSSDEPADEPTDDAASDTPSGDD